MNATTTLYEGKDVCDTGLRYVIWAYDGGVRPGIRQPKHIGWADNPAPFIQSFMRSGMIAFAVDRRPFRIGAQDFCSVCAKRLNIPHNKGLRHNSDSRVCFCSEFCSARAVQL